MNDDSINTGDYLRGMNDCLAGIDCKDEESADYKRGYSFQYQHEQNVSNNTVGGQDE